MQNVCTQGPRAQFSAQVQGPYPCRGVGTWKKKCVHIGAQIRIIPGYPAPAPRVNTAYVVCRGGQYLRADCPKGKIKFKFLAVSLLWGKKEI